MQAVVVATLVFGVEVCVFCFLESGVFHELLFDFDFDFYFYFYFYFFFIFIFILILILFVGLIGAATATPRSPCLTHCRQCHWRRRLHCAFFIFGSSFAFGSTASLQ